MGFWTPRALFIRLKIRYPLGLSGSCLGTPFRGAFKGLKYWHPKTLGTNRTFRVILRTSEALESSRGTSQEF